MIDKAAFAEWVHRLGGRRPAYRVDTRDAVDREFVSLALSEGLAIVTTPAGDVPSEDAPYLLGVRLTQSGEKLLRQDS
jgi:hypothetical protein